ncbi:MAG: dephospho-CoA kinase [Bacteroidetes bacterium]|nr:MAG: dephospho-CoA kinase [Bacteroidota bacterium]
MKKIGVTGGIGSGKSTVCRIFAALGYEVYEADKRAKALMTENPRVRQGVLNLFGREAYLPEGSLNRAYIGSIVFKDAQKLKQLNAIVHPETARDFENWMQALPAGYDKPFVLKEAAILFESGAYRGVDEVLCVYAPKTLRLKRVCQRDGVSAESVLQRMSKQWPEQQKLLRADFAIYNDEQHALTHQVLAAIRYFSAP